MPWIVHIIKKPAEINSAGPFVSLLENKKAKGEEKPEENLWGSVSLLRVLKQPSYALAVPLSYYVQSPKLYTSRSFFSKKNFFILYPFSLW